MGTAWRTYQNIIGGSVDSEIMCTNHSGSDSTSVQSVKAGYRSLGTGPSEYLWLTTFSQRWFPLFIPLALRRRQYRGTCTPKFLAPENGCCETRNTRLRVATMGCTIAAGWLLATLVRNA